MKHLIAFAAIILLIIMYFLSIYAFVPIKIEVLDYIITAPIYSLIVINLILCVIFFIVFVCTRFVLNIPQNLFHKLFNKDENYLIKKIIKAYMNIEAKCFDQASKEVLGFEYSEDLLIRKNAQIILSISSVSKDSRSHYFNELLQFSDTKHFALRKLAITLQDFDIEQSFYYASQALKYNRIDLKMLWIHVLYYNKTNGWSYIIDVLHELELNFSKEIGKFSDQIADIFYKAAKSEFAEGSAYSARTYLEYSLLYKHNHNPSIILLSQVYYHNNQYELLNEHIKKYFPIKPSYELFLFYCKINNQSNDEIYSFFESISNKKDNPGVFLRISTALDLKEECRIINSIDKISTYTAS
jgi:hypothetical protein